MGPLAKLRIWARADKARGFEIRFTNAPHPYAIDLENHDTQAAVHVDGFRKLSEAADCALGRAAKTEAL